MHSLPFFKFSPGGNTTLLIPCASLSPAQQESCAATLLHPLHLQAEQVGYIQYDPPRLHMAGGEFCVNATRAFAALLAMKGLLQRRLPLSDSATKKSTTTIQDTIFGQGQFFGSVQVSGAEAPVQVEASPLTQGPWPNAMRWAAQGPAEAPQVSENADFCTALPHFAPALQVSAVLPLPALPDCQDVAPGMCLVRLPGIAHLVLDAALHPFPLGQEAREAAAARLRARFSLQDQPAVGCVWLEQQGDLLHMHPLVWVSCLQTLCYESSCGSGALACALVLARQHKSPLSAEHQAYSLVQPSGQALQVACLPPLLPPCSSAKGGVPPQALRMCVDGGVPPHVDGGVPPQALRMCVAGPVSLIAHGTAFF